MALFFFRKERLEGVDDVRLLLQNVGPKLIVFNISQARKECRW